MYRAYDDESFFKAHNNAITSIEAEKYFDFDVRATVTTEYARQQGAWFLADQNHKHAHNGSWWLRYPEWIEGDDSALYTELSCVNLDGYIEASADEITAQTCSVRPACWLQTMARQYKRVIPAPEKPPATPADSYSFAATI